jgi:hypothetical protein
VAVPDLAIGNLISRLGDVVPIVRLPTLREVLLHVLGEAFLVKHDLRSIAIALKLEADDRIEPLGPRFGAPRLHHSFARHELDVPTGAGAARRVNSW